MKKTYVLDTNILVQSPNALLSFEENNVIIPFAVLKELDGLKKRDGDLGANARDVVRKLEEYELPLAFQRNGNGICRRTPKSRLTRLLSL